MPGRGYSGYCTQIFFSEESNGEAKGARRVPQSGLVPYLSTAHVVHAARKMLGVMFSYSTGEKHREKFDFSCTVGYTPKNEYFYEQRVRPASQG